MLNKKNILLVTIVTVLGSSILFPTTYVEANLKDKQDQIQEERSALQSELSEVDQELANILLELQELDDQVAQINQAMEDNTNKIEETKNNIEESNKEIEALELEIEDLEESMEVRYDILKQRAVSFQKSGGDISYLEVLLGAKSFGDLINRISAVSKIAQSDNDLLEQLEDSKVELEEKQTSLEEKLNSLNEMITELEGMQAMIEEQKKETDQLIEELDEKRSSNLALLAEMKEKDSSLAAKEIEIKDMIEQELRSEEQVLVQAQTEVQTLSTEISNPKNNTSSNNSTVKSSNVSDVVTVGNKYIGNSVYVYAGGRNAYDIANGRFDCSGFVSWAFLQVGVNIGASTSSLRVEGKKVSTSDMKPGDLVFFDTYKTDGHVGIYVGGGKFIGSQNTTGVAIADMNSGYWKGVFKGHVRRVIN